MEISTSQSEQEKYNSTLSFLKLKLFDIDGSTINHSETAIFNINCIVGKQNKSTENPGDSVQGITINKNQSDLIEAYTPMFRPPPQSNFARINGDFSNSFTNSYLDYTSSSQTLVSTYNQITRSQNTSIQDKPIKPSPTSANVLQMAPAIAGECCTECCPPDLSEHNSFNFPNETISYECCYRTTSYDTFSLIPIGQNSDPRQLTSPQLHKITHEKYSPEDHNEISEIPSFSRIPTSQSTTVTSDRVISEISNKDVVTVNNHSSLPISQNMTPRKVMNSINEDTMNNRLIQTNDNLLSRLISESDNISTSTTSSNIMLTSTSGTKRKQDMIFDGARCLWEACAAVFRSIDELIPHLSKLHIARRSNGISCRWASCSKEQENDDELLQHLCHDHLAAQDFQHGCKWQGCYLRFETYEELTGHVSEGHIGCGRSQYVCYWERCDRNGRPFTQRQKVMRHIQTHTGDKPYQCTICKKRFSEANIMTQHMRTHTGERPFKCPQPNCGREFSISGALTIHLRVHTGEKPFKCKHEGCVKRFAESSNLTKHVMNFNLKFSPNITVAS
ncbi:11147_t:CDS:2 [Dentiscutata erythropus]|uniref:11147_t:CDS:1 n=1 Tax=Dentiscutata erythropus TaxID=1348616 RepID=A0A9N8VRS0_9GLOM|nr:11147_t:CDS:2 [Dentiscutata erythropus]